SRASQDRFGVRSVLCPVRSGQGGGRRTRALACTRHRGASGRHLSRARRLLGACGGTPSGHHPTSAGRSHRADRLEGGFVRRPLLSTRTAGIFLGYGADRWLGDPRRFHPVAAFGSAATALEQRLYADSRARGVTHVVFLVGAATGLGIIAERVTARAPIARTAVTAVATWVVLGGRSWNGRRPPYGCCWSRRTFPVPGDDSGPWWVGTPARWTLTRCPVPWSSRWRRTRPTRSLHPFFGVRSPGFPACWPTGPSTRSMPWSAIAVPGTSGSVGPLRAWTICSTCPVRVWPRL